MILVSALLAVPFAAPTICIDPGHPSEVGPGTRGARVTEMEVAWQIGKLLRDQLKAGGYTVVMTKSDLHQKVTNQARAETANAAKAALMVRLHCDASVSSGFTVYYPTQTGTVHGVTGPSKAILDTTKPLAKSFYDGLSGVLKGKIRDNGLRSDTRTKIGGEQGALTGSIFSQVPTVLVEMVVLTNQTDEAWISSREGRLTMVNALATGVKRAVPLRH